MKRRELILITLLSLILSRGAYAASGPDLQSGLSMGDVLSRWGEPEEKVEHESRRVEVWRYERGPVVFQEGRVVAFPSAGPVRTAAAAHHHGRVPPPPPNQPAAKRTPGDSTDVISEVLREVPSEDDNAPAPGGPARRGPRGLGGQPLGGGPPSPENEP